MTQFIESHCKCSSGRMTIVLKGEENVANWCVSRAATEGLHALEIHFAISDIWITGSLSWEIKNLMAHTSHGGSMYEGSRLPDSLIIHNISTSSVTGEIIDFYVVDGNLNVDQSLILYRDVFV
jgi:hypothetical protein